jgi:GTP-binding protein Era
VKQSEAKRSGTVALAGAPNVGKSTLLNAMLGTRLSITTPKPQTTRNRIMGIVEHGSTQIAFTDTPGIHQPRVALQERMVSEARRETAGADLVCWLVGAERGLGRTDRREAPRLLDRPLLVVINKIDLVPAPRLLPLMAELAELFSGAECLPLSARSGEGVEALLSRISELLPARPWAYPADTLTDRDERFLVAETIREQLLRQLHEEVPYRTAVKIESFEERPGGAYIEADVYTDSDSTKAMIIGAGGARIKEIGKAARHAASKITGRRSIYLDLRVRVKKDWQNDPRFLDELDG